MATTFLQLVQQRESCRISKPDFVRSSLNALFQNTEFTSAQDKTFLNTVNYLSIDQTQQLILIGDSQGTVYLNQLERDYRLSDLSRIQFDSTVHRLQWFPEDNGIFCVTLPWSVRLVDTSQLAEADAYNFERQDSQLYWSDWNRENPNLIAVGCANSTIRLIDIRTGSSAHSITVQSPGGQRTHHISRVCWSPLDSELLFAGDTSGFLHLLDIRSTRRALQTVGEDNCTTEQISFLDFHPDSCRLVTGQGAQGRPVIWNFRRKKLRNTNVNFCAQDRVSKLDRAKTAFIKCQMFCTGNFLFRPIADPLSLGEVKVHCLASGRLLATFVPEAFAPSGALNTTCVTGLNSDYPIIYSGSRNTVRLWKTNNRSDQHEQTLQQMHQDDWSD